MKRFVGVGLFIWVFFLASCNSSTNSPVAEQVTLFVPTATPLREPTPTLTKTTAPIIIVLPTSTATLQPTSTPKPTATLHLPSEPTRELLITRNFDWNIYDFPDDAFTVSVPVDWYYVELNEEQLRESFENAEAPTISLMLLYNNDNYPGYVDARLKFLAVGGKDNRLAVQITKVRIPAIYQQLPVEYALQTYVDLSVTNFLMLLESNIDYERETLALNSSPAIRVVYELINVGQPYHLAEYYVVGEDYFYQLSFVSWNESWEHDFPLFEQIAQSFKSIPTAISE